MAETRQPQSLSAPQAATPAQIAMPNAKQAAAAQQWARLQMAQERAEWDHRTFLTKAWDGYNKEVAAAGRTANTDQFRALVEQRNQEFEAFKSLLEEEKSRIAQEH